MGKNAGWIIAGAISAAAVAVGLALFHTLSSDDEHGHGSHSHAHSHGGHGHSHGAHSHGGCQGGGGGHSHGDGGHGHSHGQVTFEDAPAWAEKFESAEREEWLQPERVVREVIAPLVAEAAEAGSEARPLVVDVGAGTGFFTMRLAQQLLDSADVAATDVAPGMRQYLQERIAAAAASGALPADASSRVRVLAASEDGPTPLPRKASVLFYCTVYHHLSNRVAHMREVREKWLVGGGKGFVVLLEHKTGNLPIPTPPEHYRLERSALLQEMEDAGFTLHSAPNFLPYFNILVFASA